MHSLTWSSATDKKDPHSQIKLLQEFLDALDYERYKHLPNLEEQIEACVEKISVIGGRVREEEYILQHRVDTSHKILSELAFVAC